MRLLCALTALNALALALFALGFLLTRVELPHSSTCSNFPPASRSTKRPACWTREAPFARAVLLVVDGLRWDVANGTAHSRADLQLSLPSLRRLAERPGSLLAPFLADPPTTTQQRLKGLLTGSLPTFVDAGASFGAAALEEDNLLFCLAAQGRRAAVLGDDTWTQLFPTDGCGGAAEASGGRCVWSEAHPFPSLDVRDLHSVDSGVARLLPGMLQQPGEWAVLIAHFLGVDHAGHTFGLDSAAMAAKLAEIDQLIADVHATLSSDARHADSLLLVFGDHGMTHAGDHGGGTPEEVTSALFAASFRSSAGAGAQRDARAPPAAAAVPQLDFAVSLALLLGLPVPFGSLGTLSKELWQLGAPGGGDEGFAEALQANSAQVRRALLTYGQRGAFAAADVQRLERLFDAAAAAEGEAALLGALAQAAALARRQWTQFDARAMAAGLALFCLSLALHARACWRGLLTWRARELSGWGDSKFAPLALFSLAAALAHALGCFSVGFMQNEQAAGHWPAIAVSVAHALASAIPPSSFSVSRRHAAAAVALLLVSGALYLARMTGEDKLGGATSSLSALCGTVLSLLMLPAILLRPHAMQGAARSGRRGSPQRPLSLLAFSLLLLRSLLPPHSLLARIALPRLVYALAVVNLALAALTGGWRHNACLAALLPPLAMLCGRRGPLLALLALLQGASLLRCHSPAAAAVAAPAESTHSLSRASEAARLLLWRSDAWRLLSLAAGLHCASLQLFSATGHRSSFDALHFSAAFTGFDSFSFGTQGALLAANTWAADLGGLAALPLAAAALSHGRPGAWRALRLLVLCRAALRLVEAACAAAAAAVLRRHLHVWSHFAPKFVFEAVGLLLIDALLLLMLMLAPRDTAGGKDEMDKTE